MTGTIVDNSSARFSSLFTDGPSNHPCASKPLAPGHEREATAEPAAAPSAVRPAPGLWESLGWTLAFVLVTQAIPFFVLGFWVVISRRGPQMFFANFLPTLLCGQLLGVTLSVFALRVRLGRSWMCAINLRRPALVPSLLAALCLPGFMVVAGGATHLVEHVLDVHSPSLQFVMASAAQHGLWFSLLVIAVGAAVNEELFCRGFLGRGLVGRYGVLCGVLCTSLIFALLHGNLTQGIFALLLGCFVHLAYLATRSLWIPVVLHLLNNAWVVVVSFLFAHMSGAVEQTASGFLGLPEWLGLAIGLGILAMSLLPAWGLYRLRDRRVAAA